MNAELSAPAADAAMSSYMCSHAPALTSSITIVQHNCASSSFVFHTLFSTLQNPTKVAIQDPYIWNNSSVYAPGFSLIYLLISPIQKICAYFDISNTFVSKFNCSFLPLF
jgi:hypothetical protein